MGINLMINFNDLNFFLLFTKSTSKFIVKISTKSIYSHSQTSPAARARCFPPGACHPPLSMRVTGEPPTPTLRPSRAAR